MRTDKTTPLHWDEASLWIRGITLPPESMLIALYSRNVAVDSMAVGDRALNASAYVRVVVGMSIEPIRDSGVLVRLHDAVNQQGLNPVVQQELP